MTKAEQLVGWARDHIGCPYIFGAAGQTCTPNYRRSVMANKPDYAAAIRDNCPVLSGLQATCARCRYNGRPSYDCRGLTREAIRAVTDRPVMGAGATSQWNDNSNWAIKGPISAMPDRPCLVFVAKGSTMSHTGIYIGGAAIHASGHKAGVIESPMPRSWTHYAEPIGLYDTAPGAPVPPPVETSPRLLRYASPYMRGDDVKQVQLRLMELGYGVGIKGADGIYGAFTLHAVQAFQTAHGLSVDGIVGPATLAALTTSPPPITLYRVTISGLTAAQRDALAAQYPAAAVEVSVS